MKVNATLESDGRLKIPWEVRERLNHRPGSRVTLTIGKEIAEQQTQEAPLAKLVKRGGKWVMDCPTTPKITFEDIITAIKPERAEREQRIAWGRRWARRARLSS